MQKTLEKYRISWQNAVAKEIKHSSTHYNAEMKVRFKTQVAITCLISLRASCFVYEDNLIMFHISLRPAILLSKSPLACFRDFIHVGNQKITHHNYEPYNVVRYLLSPYKTIYCREKGDSQSLKAILVLSRKAVDDDPGCRSSSSFSCCDCGAQEETLLLNCCHL